MEIKDLLVPRSKYAEVRKNYGDSPFTFEMRKKDQVLFYFGANHSNDPKNAQFPHLDEYWALFLKETDGKERIVFVEGELRKLRSSKEEAISGGSEGGYITFLAHQEGVPVICPDITKFEYLKDKSEEEKNISLIHSFISWSEQFRKHSDKTRDFEKELEKWCEFQRGREVWIGMEVTPQKLKDDFKRVVGKEFNYKENLNYLVNPNIKGPITIFTRYFSDEREIRIIENAVKYWEEGKSIFIVFGSSHLVLQRPALEKLLI